MKPNLDLWNEVSELIDGGQHVDVTKAIKSLCEAIQAIGSHNDLSCFAEARTFVNKYISRIVTILLHQLDIGDLGSSEKSRAKSCLGSVLTLVAGDLEIASKRKFRCPTLSALTEIFDGVSDYQRNDIRRLILMFKKANGFVHLAKYLDGLKKTSMFPRLDAVASILDMLESAVENIWSKTGHDHEWITEFASQITEPVMLNLVSVDESTFEHLHDDLIDIFRRLNGIRDRLLLSSTRTLPLHRELIRRLIGSSSLQLKQAGWRELQNNIRATAKPPPKAYLVKGAGIDIFNGKYRSRGPTSDYARSIYIRNVREVDKILALSVTHSSGKHQWFLCEIELHPPETTMKTLCYKQMSGSAKPPSTGWVTGEDGMDPPPTLTPTGLTLQDNDLFDWIFKNNVLEMALKDYEIDGQRDIQLRFEASRAKQSILNSIQEPLDLILKTIQEQPNDYSCCYDALGFVQMIISHLMLLDNYVLKSLGQHFIISTFKKLQQVYEQIMGTISDHNMLDFYIFKGLMTLRLSLLGSEPESLKIGLKHLYEVTLEYYLPQAYVREEVGISIVNDEYVLNGKANEEVKMERYGDQFITIHRISHGPESGRWVISQHCEGLADEEALEHFYINIHDEERIPPETGWAILECERDEYPGPVSDYPPTLTAEGAELKFVTFQQQIEFWSIFLRLFLAAGLPAAQRTSTMKDNILYCLASLFIVWDDSDYILDVAFLECAYKIVAELFIESKGSPSIGKFLVDRKRKRSSNSEAQNL